MIPICEEQGDDLLSDCESGVSGMGYDEELEDERLVTMAEGDEIFGVIKKRVVYSLNSHGLNGEIVRIQRIRYSDVMNRARYLSFGIYREAVEVKNGGNANVKYAWFGCSKPEMEKIVLNGFGLPEITERNSSGVHLSPARCPVNSVVSLHPDKDGNKHLLLCRVILGKTGRQFSPSSEKFDSVADDLDSPTRYIIGSRNINTHILPEFVVTFKTTVFFSGFRDKTESQRRSKTGQIPFALIIDELSKILPVNEIKFIVNDYRKQRITKREMIQRVRKIAGDKLLIRIINSYRQKLR